MRKDQGRLDTIPGTLPAIGAHLQGCVFADRCGLAQPICREQEPDLFVVNELRRSRCHFWPEAHTVPRTAAASTVTAVQAPNGAPVMIQADGVHKTFKQDGLDIRALTDIDVELRPGETLGLVGESGSGKTTFARVLLGLTAPDAGSTIELDGKPLAGTLSGRRTEQVRAIQIVFQNPDAALNRRAGVRRIIGRAATRLLGLRGKQLESHVQKIAAGVRLSERHLDAKPNQLSGGLKQRVAIARAFAGDPRVVVCDEPTSALDVSVQAAILNLLADLQVDQTTSYLFISHDLGVVRYLSDRIAVLYLGHVLELGDAERVFSGPHHPYTEALLSAVPTIEGVNTKRIRLAGEIPSAAHLPSGCVFHSRCPRKKSALCETEQPPLLEKEPGHWMRCHWTIEELAELQRTAPAGLPALPSI
jgi:peptide/nickel transport system ATP-binding protein